MEVDGLSEAQAEDELRGKAIQEKKLPPRVPPALITPPAETVAKPADNDNEGGESVWRVLCKLAKSSIVTVCFRGKAAAEEEERAAEESACAG